MNIRELHCLIVASALCLVPALARAQARPPHIMVLVDTSGSMLQDLDGNLTGGDGSSSLTPHGNICCPGWDEDGEPGPDGYNSRLFIAKEVLTDVVLSVGVGEVVFGMATYWQGMYPGWTHCNGNNIASYYGNDDGYCSTVVDGYHEDRISFSGASCYYSSQDTGRIVVPYAADDSNRDYLLSWIDHHEESYADCDSPECDGLPCVGVTGYRGCFVNPELRAINGTPLSGAIDTLADYFHNDVEGEPCEQFAVVLTDGEQSSNCDGEPDVAVAGLADEGVTVYVIAFALDSSLLGIMDDMAYEGGTGYARVANSRDDLRAAFAEIIQAAIRVEECNNEDDDCDGLVDENLYRPCDTDCGPGQEQCVAGVWRADTCTAPEPVPEECNNIDDDCDGDVDEELTRSCANDCGPGTETCFRGGWVGCTAPTGELEICDGEDNDCDGDVDESDPLVGTACGSGVGACTVGTWQCVEGELVCSGEGPSEEECNDVDDDCDGDVDEGLYQACVNADGCEGVERCVGGDWVDCDAPDARAEVCNGLDDDCDGVVDDVEPLSCSTACGDGTRECVGGRWGPCSARDPSVEVCDGLDNDCDGSTDEGVTRSCAVGTCVGVQSCIGPDSWGPCSAAPTDEMCNGMDDDCDGSTDEDLVRHCSSACGSGTQTCTAGTWSDCTAPMPELEECNGLDDDCNGLIDDGLYRPCSTICEDGVETCVDGLWLDCTAREPSEEICNGIDDDCDGLEDEEYPEVDEECGTDEGVCEMGMYDCVDGVLECVDDVEPTPEICDGLDNDCDGEVDEGLGLGSACCFGSDGCVGNVDDPTGECDCEEYSYAATSACVVGHFVCEDAEVVCQGFGWPSAEECDCIDNDCDGFVDEGLPVGDYCGIDEGECEYGRLQCVECQWLCVGGVEPTPEICDLLDNDCDGEVDEDFEFLCPDEDAVCIEGECALPCGTGEFPCPPGKTCRDGYCLGDPCEGVQCAECERCNSATGACEDLCTGVECPSGTFCECGRCYPDNCYYRGCDEGEVCRNGECVVDPCAGVSCEEGQFCRDGECFGVCTPEIECPRGQRCRDGECVSDLCYGVTCDSGEVCVASTGECSSACRGVTCAEGQECDPATGECVDDPCLSIRCPEGTHCDDGTCVTDGTGDPDAGPEHAPLYVLGTGGGGCACSAAEPSSGSSAGGLALLLAVAGCIGLARRR